MKQLFNNLWIDSNFFVGYGHLLIFYHNWLEIRHFIGWPTTKFPITGLWLYHKNLKKCGIMQKLIRFFRLFTSMSGLDFPLTTNSKKRRSVSKICLFRDKIDNYHAVIRRVLNRVTFNRCSETLQVLILPQSDGFTVVTSGTTSTWNRENL